jgi:hypothetical protein
MNLGSYDLILGTPFLFQHRVTLGFNEARVMVGSDKSLPIVGENVLKLSACMAELVNNDVETVRSNLMEEANGLGLFTPVEEQPLPPMRAIINHVIPLIDESMIYPWRPSQCPEVFRKQRVGKKNIYVRTGHWRHTTVTNTVPLMCIPKPNKPKDKPELRVSIDLHARNANTVKMSAPLPPIDGIIRRAASHRFVSLMDMSAAYEHMRVVPEHVPQTTMATPDGNMESLVMQIGDCNAPSPWQALITHSFSPYIGQFMDVYIDDDIVIYSDSLRDHIEHVRKVFDVLH